MREQLRKNEISFYSTSGTPVTPQNRIVSGAQYRFSLISPIILRLEYSANGIFEDRPSSFAINRDLEDTDFTVFEKNKQLIIRTKRWTLYYQKGMPFSSNTLYIDVHNRYTNYGGRWYFGQKEYGNPPRHHNLYGTIRTLDKLNGSCPLDFGVMDSSGRSAINDSNSFVLDQDGRYIARDKLSVDWYYFACNHDYLDTLRDFYRLTGAPPFLPRYALGNWWSRYYAYTSEEYLALMDRFSENNMPFSVAMLDMDWHNVNVPDDCGRGWTGYSWNRKLFPSPESFFSELKKRGLYCGMNLHPADGIQPCEDKYSECAAVVGVDPEGRFPIPFDCEDEQFLDAYFNHLLHPIEKEGADFWWIDWQQGNSCTQSGLDPLLQLNREHYLDSLGENQRKRGLILSRYAGLGSHRYPVGFSGDTVSSWDSLAFQPYFTATAANVGFTWWSHDIGGFKSGNRDRELYLRWIQYGIFSPIFRMHCSNNSFTSKEPWHYDSEIQRIVTRYLNLRYELLPYWYTMNYQCHSKLQPVVYPVYYRHPDNNAAYSAYNQYYFGTELLVCAITKPCSDVTGLASVMAWIPDGIWTDFFTGKIYHGSRRQILNRSLENQCVLAKPGAIVPMDQRNEFNNSLSNPESLNIHIFPGASNHFTLYEDGGDGFEYRDGDSAFTDIEWIWEEDHAALHMSVSGNVCRIPEKRHYRFLFRSMICEDIQTNSNMHIQQDSKGLVIEAYLPVSEEICIELRDIRLITRDIREDIQILLDHTILPAEQKNDIYRLYKSQMMTPCSILIQLQAMHLPTSLMDALVELTTD